MIETMMCMKMFQRKLGSEMEKNTSMVKVAFRLWELEVTDSRFYDNEPHMHAVKITPFMVGVVRKEPHKVWDERIFSAFDREKKPASRIAKVALLHLEKSIAPRTFDVEKAEEDTELMLRLREHPEIQFAFHSQECFKLLIKALTVFTSKPLSAQTAKLFAKAIASCFMVIGYLLDFSDGAPWVIQFLEAGIIPAALNCAPWVPYFERQLNHDQVEYLFAHILPRYSMYKSVLKVIADKADKVEGWENAQSKLVGPGLSRFNDHWKIFVSMTKIRTPVLMKYHDMHMHRCAVADFCQKCGAVEHLKRCFGCFEVYYCSKECQTADWKSSHKAKCQRIQAIRKSGGTTEPSIDDILFAKRIIHCDLGTAPFAKEVLAAIPKTQPTDSTSSSNIISLHIDYLDFPFTARARIGYNAQQSCGYHLKIVKDLESKARHSPSSDPNDNRYLVVKGWISRGYEQRLIFVSLPFNDQKRWEDLDMWVNPNALGPDDGDGCRDGKCKFVDVRMDSSAVI
ncbi:hypothetical protein C8Q75DRAFT_531436 [Abortiporus biennis]|nr:hypothetical protein C8Q75DRAFT_531436 [Abortiporus biennis]